MGYVSLLFVTSTLVSSVGRAWDCSEKKLSSHGLRFNSGTGEFIILFFIFIGKFAQRSNLIKTEMVHEPSRFFELMYKTEFEVCDARMVNENMVEVQYRNMEDYITSFVSGGPKNYAYRTKKGKTDTRIHGITLDHATTGKINHDVVRALVHLHTNCDTEAKVTVDIPFKITRDKKEKNIVTKK